MDDEWNKNCTKECPGKFPGDWKTWDCLANDEGNRYGFSLMNFYISGCYSTLFSHPYRAMISYGYAL